MVRSFTFIISAVVCLFWNSCSRISEKLESAERLMEIAPDSSLHILQKINPTQFITKSDKALYALLMTQALDKNDIKIESDSLISKATDYFDDNEPKRAAYAWFYKSRIANNYGNAEKQSDALLRAREFAELSGDTKLSGLVYFEINKMYFDQKQYPVSISYSKKAYSEFIKIKDYRNSILALINTGYSYSNNKDIHSAATYYKKAEQLLKFTKDVQLHATVYRCLATVYFDKKDYNNEINYLKHIKKTNDPIYDSNTYLLLANAYMKLNKPDSSLYYLKQMTYIGIMAPIYYKLQENIYEQKGNLDKALFYSRKVKFATDSLHTVQLNESFAGLEKKYKYQKLQITNQQLAIHNKQNNILLLIALVIISLGTIIFLFKLNINRKKEILNQQIIIENERLLLEKEIKLHEKETINNKLLEKQNKIQLILISNVEQYRQQAIKKPDKKVNEPSPVSNPTFYEEVIASMDVEYNDISKRLYSTFPELTQRDILICCLLLSGFDSGMIGTILNIKNDSVIKQRHRIRIKLYLKNSENLTEFLQNF